MKRTNKLLCIALSAILAIGAFAGCGGEKSEVKNEVKNETQTKVEKFEVKFDTDGGSSISAQSVEKGEKAVRPADPEKADFYFNGWYLDKDGTTAFDFDAEILSDTTVYASWIDASGTVTAKFMSDSNTVSATVHFKDGGRIAKPADPVKDGYYFAGWFDSDGTQYKATVKYTGEKTFTAKWLKIYTFEAENTQLTGLDPEEDDTCSDSGNKLGQSYSGNVSGANLINSCACNASGDAYVTNLYYNGAFLEFEITSDKDTDSALLFLRLSGEFTTISLNKDTFLVKVNDNKINYEPITIVGGSTDDLTSTSRTPMNDYAMGTVSLKAGKNVVRLEVNNSDKQFATGTMDAAAPLIDAIKLYSDTALTMKEYKNR